MDIRGTPTVLAPKLPDSYSQAGHLLEAASMHACLQTLPALPVR